ncbi:MAG: helix-turn-helix domain-containing protein [Streptosporangiaceae bacterium]
MSVEAISWALNLAPVPAGRGSQPSSAAKFVLVGLANHAGPDGTGAFPSVATLVRYTGLSERTVRTCLDRLEACELIQPCDPDIVAARIKRADRRPQGWDLDLAMIRDDLTEAEVAALERQFPGLAARLAAVREAGRSDGISDGEQPAYPVTDPVDNPPDEVQLLHPVAGTGCNQRANGVHLVQPRGAAAAPEPYLEPSREPSAAVAQAREEPAPPGAASVPATAGDVRAGEFFAALGNDWNMTGSHRAKLMPLVMAALQAGWSPGGLARFTGANTSGVRNPYAVLAARLSAAELPDPPTRQRPAQHVWCGQCDQRTRMLNFDSDAPIPCPMCKPKAGKSKSATPMADFGLPYRR